MKNKSLIVAKYEFLKTVKRKGFLFSAIFLPLLVMFPLMFAMHYIPSLISQTTANEKIGFVDYSDFLEPDQNFIGYTDIEAAKQAWINDNISSFFVIQKDYFNTSKITIYSKDESFFSSTPTKTIEGFLMKNLLRYGNVDDVIAEKIENPMVAEKITLDEQGNIKEEKSKAGGFLLPYALTFLLMLSIMTSSGYLMQGIGEEKESKTGELLLSSISADQLLRGKILGYGSVGLLQIGIWILVGLIMIFNSPLAGLFAGIEISSVFALAILYFILGYFLFAVSIACAAAISPSAREAQQTSMIFTIFAIIPLMFAQFIMMAPNSMVAKIFTYFPYSSPFITMMRLPLTEVPFHEIALSIVILIISISIITKLSGKIFRMGMLMYGKRASLREVVGFFKEK
ncbi:MAG: ABC transporter permease [Minisyncoccales bacterium]